MLQITPKDDQEHEADEQSDDAIYCAVCGHLVTRGRWRLSLDGHQHTHTNPMGITFHLRLFSEAPGAGDHGAPTEEHSWFAGYAWNFANCRDCGEHLGWRFTGTASPRLFFGLIDERLSSSPK